MLIFKNDLDTIASRDELQTAATRAILGHAQLT